MTLSNVAEPQVGAPPGLSDPSATVTDDMRQCSRRLVRSEIPMTADGGATAMEAGADLDRSAPGAAAARRRWGWVDPRSWGIPVRSALAAALVVLFTFLAMAAVVLGCCIGSC